MRLTDFDPQWIDHADRHGLGVSFRCLTGHCNGRCWILFAEPLDGGPAVAEDCMKLMFAKRDAGEKLNAHDRPCGKYRWKRTGDTFETLTLEPSVEAHLCGHVTLTNGSFTRH